jgi:hypothetical protein
MHIECEACESIQDHCAGCGTESLVIVGEEELLSQLRALRDELEEVEDRLTFWMASAAHWKALAKRNEQIINEMKGKL